MLSLITPLAGGWIAGTALQLQQGQLWSMGAYAVVAVFVVIGIACTRLLLRPRGWFWLGFVLAGGLAFAQTGMRACGYMQTTLNPDLEGQTLHVVGVVANLPQRLDDSARFRFEVTSARDSYGVQVHLPPLLLLGWYGNSVSGRNDAWGAPPALLRPGDRWQFSVRLKAPHGHINPHGFDYELWLWEQHIQATGYVRHGKQDAPPKWLGSTWMYPLERLRQHVRDAVNAQVNDPVLAGVVVALLVGDQAAIERSDWTVFRATGVAHLMAISGLHITGLAWLAAWCTGWLWRRSDVWYDSVPWSLRLPAPMAASVCGLAVGWGYALFTGWGCPHNARPGCWLW